MRGTYFDIMISFVPRYGGFGKCAFFRGVVKVETQAQRGFLRADRRELTVYKLHVTGRGVGSPRMTGGGAVRLRWRADFLGEV